MDTSIFFMSLIFQISNVLFLKIAGRKGVIISKVLGVLLFIVCFSFYFNFILFCLAKD